MIEINCWKEDRVAVLLFKLSTPEIEVSFSLFRVIQRQADDSQL
jgi:hypothetical protein